jgi:hypothetical protein
MTSLQRRKEESSSELAAKAKSMYDHWVEYYLEGVPYRTAETSATVLS